jgi:hypothetical protein
MIAASSDVAGELSGRVCPITSTVEAILASGGRSSPPLPRRSSDRMNGVSTASPSAPIAPHMAEKGAKFRPSGARVMVRPPRSPPRQMVAGILRLSHSAPATMQTSPTSPTLLDKCPAPALPLAGMGYEASSLCNHLRVIKRPVATHQPNRTKSPFPAMRIPNVTETRSSAPPAA